MNQPPKEFIRISADSLQSFIETCLKKAGLDAEHAELTAKLLTECDLRGIHSHGASRMSMYCTDLKEGKSNPSPRIRVVKDEPTFVIIDGDGGIGYLPTVQGTRMAIEKAKKHGMGAAAVKHIGHYGASGIYTRMCIDEDCIGFSVQGSAQLIFPPRPVTMLGSPPMSFAFPGKEEPPIVLDFNTHFFNEGELDLFDRIPAVFYKSLGLTLSAKMLAGVLVGQMLKEGRDIVERYPSHAGGGFVLAIDISQFVPVEAFKEEVDRFHRDIREQMKPMPGYDRTILPGTLEAELEKTYRTEGIPLSKDIIERLESAAGDLGVPYPWSKP